MGQCGPQVTPEKFKSALKALGFADVYETAIGADMGWMAEAKHYVEKVVTGEVTNIAINQAKREMKHFIDGSEKKLPEQES